MHSKRTYLLLTYEFEEFTATGFRGFQEKLLKYFSFTWSNRAFVQIMLPRSWAEPKLFVVIAMKYLSEIVIGRNLYVFTVVTEHLLMYGSVAKGSKYVHELRKPISFTY